MLISFEDLYETGALTGPMPAGYAGFTWSESAWFVTRRCYPSARFHGMVALFNSGGRDLHFERGSPFHLRSLGLSVLWRERIEVLLEGWEKGTRKYQETISATKNATVKCCVDFRGVDRVAIGTDGGHVLLDEIILDNG